jgi:Na+-driven multidrug efflux pump
MTGVAINFLLCLMLIPVWGLIGAAFASSVSFIGATFFAVIFFSRISRIPLIQVISFKKEDFQDLKIQFNKVLEVASSKFHGVSE